MIKVLETQVKNRGIKVSFWFDPGLTYEDKKGRRINPGFYNTLVEDVDESGNVTSGRLIRGNVRLISAVLYAKDWVVNNKPELVREVIQA